MLQLYKADQGLMTIWRTRRPPSLRKNEITLWTGRSQRQRVRTIGQDRTRMYFGTAQSRASETSTWSSLRHNEAGVAHDLSYPSNSTCSENSLPTPRCRRARSCTVQPRSREVQRWEYRQHIMFFIVRLRLNHARDQLNTPSVKSPETHQLDWASLKLAKIR